MVMWKVEIAKLYDFCSASSILSNFFFQNQNRITRNFKISANPKFRPPSNLTPCQRKRFRPKFMIMKVTNKL